MKAVNKKINVRDYEDILNRVTTYTLRIDEDNIIPGDILCLREIERIPNKPYETTRGMEFAPMEERYTGRALLVEVTDVLRNHEGLEKGYAIYNIELIKEKKKDKIEVE